MKKTNITVADVRAVYSGPEGDLWKLIMGEQIHVGGFTSSMALAESAGIKEGDYVLDICSNLGAGMRFLTRYKGARCVGVDATEHVVEIAKRRAAEEGLEMEFHLADAMDLPLDDGTFDVVWGEDAWCYVECKDTLIKEAARTLKPGGTIAFTDWIEGPSGMADEEADRINTFMKFPYMESLGGYTAILEKHGFEVKETTDLTPEFAEYIALYMQMVGKQLTYDALALLGHNMEMLQGVAGEMEFMQKAAADGKFGRCRVVAVKK